MKKLSVAGETRDFYKSLFILVGPIALQNFISAAVNSADVIMLGYVGQTELAASSLAGQIQFILFLFFTGLSSGLAMLVSQYWGKHDTKSIETLAGYALKISIVVAAIFSGAACFAPRFCMRIFTNDDALINSGALYLRIVGISYLLLSVSQVYQALMRSIERVKVVTAITFIALGTNIILNAVFIFGLLGAPKMGIQGVALATTIARALELILCFIDSIIQKHRLTQLFAQQTSTQSLQQDSENQKNNTEFPPTIYLTPAILFRRNSLLLRDFFYYSMPALGNEFIWGAAFAVYSVIMGHLGADIVAANSVITVIRNLAGVLCFGMAYGGAVLVGKKMGANDLDGARKYASRLVRSTIIAGVAGGLLVLVLRPLAFNMAHLSETALADLNVMLYINSVYIIGAATNTVLICGVFRAGGDAKFGFILDIIIMWAVSIPLGLIAALVLKLPPIAVYAVLCLDEFEKMPFIIAHYKNGKWAKNITRDF